ncbi:MAG: molybdenum cofactor guanylyltransferase [Chthoniobacterales bacterium]
MNSPFSALLLAGGKSTRMQRDKAFLAIAGEPLWRRQLGLLMSLRPHDVFVAGPRHREWIDATCKIIPDAAAAAGPLGALVAGLRVCASPLLLVLAVDLPCMTADCLRSVLQLCAPSKGVIPKTDRLEPLAAIYPTTTLGFAEEQLAAGEFSMHAFVQRCMQDGLIREWSVPPSQAPLFLNANTPLDLERANEQTS